MVYDVHALEQYLLDTDTCVMQSTPFQRYNYAPLVTILLSVDVPQGSKGTPPGYLLCPSV